jgi:nicotinate phosphoribosyltransferase
MSLIRPASLLDTDLYKFTMQQVALRQFPDAFVQYRFRCRDASVDLRPILGDIQDGLDALCEMSFSSADVDYLSTLRYIKPSYAQFLRSFRLSREAIVAKEDASEPGGVSIQIEAPWFAGILFETPVLALVSEAHMRRLGPVKALWSEGERRLEQKIERLARDPRADGLKFSDFGARRRFSGDWHRHVVARLAESLPDKFLGTSDPHFAREFGLIPMGTMAHEFLQACQVLCGGDLRHFQEFALEAWAREYRGDLGIALTDVVGFDAFLRSFDMYFCKLFDGMRHDSGDPFEWGEKAIAHYKANRVDARTKTLVFSDGLDVAKAIDLHERFRDRAQPVFGIGTNLTCDMGVKPLSIVMKMIRCNGQSVAKISDSPGKAMCQDQAYLEHLARLFLLGAAAPAPVQKAAAPRAAFAR